MDLTNNQIRLSGEILGSSFVDGTTNNSLALTDSFQQVGGLQVSFTSDRTGSVEVYIQAYVEKSSGGGVVGAIFRLTDNNNNEISGTPREVIEFHSSDGRQLACFSYILSVTEDTSYTYKVQARRGANTQDFNIYWAGDYPALFIKVIGL